MNDNFGAISPWPWHVVDKGGGVEMVDANGVTVCRFYTEPGYGEVFNEENAVTNAVFILAAMGVFLATK
ncbi:MAG TPA: hypothetical protein PKV67_01005 [Hyphomonas sp.]|nr:hypothetical protein [Hyphomonas sp.]HRI99325.1 hypothetical protein [Hyphomonas sp.]